MDRLYKGVSQMKNTVKTFPYYYISFHSGSGIVNRLRTTKLLRIMYRIRHFAVDFKWSKAFLKFQYDAKYHNEGVYTNVKDLEHAYRAFEEIIPEFKN